MKTFTIISVLAIWIAVPFSNSAFAQVTPVLEESKEAPVTEATLKMEPNARQPSRLQPASFQGEYMSVEESQAIKKENKALGQEARQTQQEYKKLEMEAKKAQRSARQVENEIKRAERAEMRAIKARQEADMQEEKTRRAIDRYLGNE
jgi:septal ring factor EnvC (AmiA/AmiB activator)